jgi:serine/threonine protein kinase
LKLIDLGLARSPTGLSEAENITTYRQLLGTFDYIAPEQCEDSHWVDIRADIYSLGCTFYELLAGQVPFAAAGSVLMKIRAHAQEPVPPISERRSDIPEPLTAALQRMLAKDRQDRFATPADVAAALQLFAAGADLRRLLH